MRCATLASLQSPTQHNITHHASRSTQHAARSTQHATRNTHTYSTHLNSPNLTTPPHHHTTCGKLPGPWDCMLLVDHHITTATQLTQPHHTIHKLKVLFSSAQSIQQGGAGEASSFQFHTPQHFNYGFDVIGTSSFSSSSSHLYLTFSSLSII